VGAILNLEKVLRLVYRLAYLSLPRQVFSGSRRIPYLERSKAMIQQSERIPTQTPTSEKKRFWSKKRLMQISWGTLGSALFIVLSYFVALIIALGPVTAYRMVTNGDSNVNTYKIFPQRVIARGGPISTLKQENLVNFPTTITYTFDDHRYTSQLSDLLAQTDTQAFIVIHNDTIIYEKYLNGARPDTIFTSFSMAKSFTSALIGIAIDEGLIKSIDDPVIKYVPELKGRGFDTLTIRNMLRMDTGIAFQHDIGFSLLNPFVSDDAKQYYTDNLYQLLMNVHRSDQPIGADFHYNDFYALLEGLILKRVTGETVTQFTQDTLWQPMGMQYSASWSLDSISDGFEKTNSALNARAIDFARFGLLYLHEGDWNGHQILSPSWVTASTTPDPTDQRPFKENPTWKQAGGYYKYGWWGLHNPDGTYDYLAWGKQDQIIYISPSTNTVVVRLGGGADLSQQWPIMIQALVHSLPASTSS
jgi:CubicO group peptidase (beta-lactamase class C family)